MLYLQQKGDSLNCFISLLYLITQIFEAVTKWNPMAIRYKDPSPSILKKPWDVLGLW